MSSESKLQFKDTNEFLFENNSTLFIVYSHTSKGKLDTYCSKPENLADIIVYIKDRYLDKKSDLKSRNVKLVSYTNNIINIMQTSVYKDITSYKNYYIYHKNSSLIFEFLELFKELQF